MKKLLLILNLCLIIILANSTLSQANHLMGGDCTYRDIGNGRVEVKIMVYRDCTSGNGAAALDNTITYYRYPATDVANSKYSTFTTRAVKLFQTKTVQPEAPRCKPPAGLCVQLGIYLDTFTIGTDTLGYHLVWARDFRNYNAPITNIVKGTSCGAFNPNPRNPYGSIWYCFVPVKTIVNSSPQFLTNPIPFVCSGRTTVFNPLVSDKDKDSLVFSLEKPSSPIGNCNTNGFPTPVPPGHPNFLSVVYGSGYSAGNPFGSGSSASINSVTGEISVNPASNGNYIVAIQIAEYRVNPVTRKARFIGYIRRDLQFVVGSCSVSYAPQYVKDTLGYTRYLNVGDTLNISAIARSTGDTVYMAATGGIFSNNASIVPPYATVTGTLIGYKSAELKIKWVPSCNHITFTSPHVITVSASDENCNTVYRTYSIYVKTKTIYRPPAFRCVNIVGKDSIKITFTDTAKKKDFSYFKIYRDTALSGNFVLVDSINNYLKTSWTDKKATNANTKYYRYFITTQNSCGLEGLPSDTMGNILVIPNKMTDKMVRINWNIHSKRYAFTYYIYTDVGTGLKLKDSTKKNFYDMRNCNLSFKTQIQVKDTAKWCSSISNTTNSIILKDSTAPNINNKLLNASVIGRDSIEITFNKSDSNDTKRYILYRSIAGNTYTAIDTVIHIKATNTYSLIDKKATNSTLNQYCYSIKAEDTCGQLSKFSNTICVARLTGTGQQLNHNLIWKKTLSTPSDTVFVQKLINGIWTSIPTSARLVNRDSIYNEVVSCNITTTFRLAYYRSQIMAYSYSNAVAITSFDTVSPNRVNILSASVINSSEILLKFNKVANVDVRKYEIYRRTGTGSISLLTTLTDPVNSSGTVSYNDKSVNTLTNTYSYQVYAVDSCGPNKSKTSEAHKTILVKAKAKNLSIDLTWNSYRGFNVSSYSILRLNNNVWTNIGSTTDTFFTNLPLNCNVTRQYKVMANELGGDNESALSDSTSATPFDTIAPAKIKLVFASVLADDEVLLVWNKTKDVDTRKYIIQRRTGSSGTFVNIDTTVVDTFYNDNNVNAAGNHYSYRIIAMDSCANNRSIPSEFFNTHLLNTTITGCQQKIDLNWNNTKGTGQTISSFNIYRSTQGGSFSLLTNVNGTQSTYTDNAITNVYFYEYYIQPLYLGVAEPIASNLVINITHRPNPSIILGASKIITNTSTGTVELTWQSVTGEPYAKNVLVYGRLVGQSWSLLYTAKPNENNYTHTGLNTRFSNYEYQIVTVDSCGNYGDSSIIHRTIELKMTVGQLVHDLAWTGYKGITPSITFIQNRQGSSYVTVDSLANPSDTTWRKFPAPCNSAVFYRVAIVDSSGNTFYSDTAGGQAIDIIPANSPVILNVTSQPHRGFTITFKGSDSADVYGYSVERNSGTGYKRLTFILYGGSQLSYTYNDTSAKIGQNYCYRIVTNDSCLNASNSEVFCPISIKGIARNQENLIDWTKFRGRSITSYNLETYNTMTKSWQTTITGLSNIDTQYLHLPLSCGIPVSYRVKAVRADGPISYSDSITRVPFDTIKPSKPIVKAVTVLPANGIRLSWAFNPNSDIKFYDIYRKDSTSAYTKIVTVTRDSVYIDRPGNLNKYYSYYIVAIDSCDGTHRSNASIEYGTMRLRLSTKDCKPLVRISFGAFIGYGSSNTSYNILRSTSRSGTYSIIQSQSNNQLYIDNNVDTSSRFYYYVQARNTSTGLISNGDTLSIKPRIFEAPLPLSITEVDVTSTSSTNGSVNISWISPNINDTFIIGYRLYHSIVANGTYTLLSDIKNLGTLSYVHSSTNTKTSANYYYLVGYNKCLTEGFIPIKYLAINLSVTAVNNSNNISFNKYRGAVVTRYEIDRSEGSNGLTTKYYVPSSDSTFADTNISCGKVYNYRIKAFNIAQPNLLIHSDTVRVRALDNLAPQIANQVSASVTSSSASNGTNELTFLVAGDKNRKSSYIYRSSNGVFFLIDSFKSNSTGLVRYVDSKANNKTTAYSYFIRSIDSCGNIATPSDTHTTVLLEATAQNAYNRVSWTEYIGFKSTRYTLEKRSNFGVWVPIYTLNTSGFYNDADVRCRTNYEYRITVFDSLNSVSAFSNTDTVVSYENNAPEPPILDLATVTKTGSNTGIIALKWTASNASDKSKYLVYRRQTTNWNLIAQLPNTQLTYNDTALNTYREKYQYKVRVIDTCGNLSNDLFAFTHSPVSLKTVSGNESIELSWTPYDGFNINRYNIYRNGILITSFASSVTAFTDTQKVCFRKYSYVIEAIGNKDVSFSNRDSAQPFDIIAPKPVHLISASVAKSNGAVEIKWAKSGNWDASGFKLYRRKLPNGDLKVIYQTKNQNDTTYRDSTVLHQEGFCYQVTVVDSCGNMSLFSNLGCTIGLKVESKPLQHLLSWSPYRQWLNPIKKYVVYRRSNDTGVWVLIGSAIGTKTNWADLAIPTDGGNFCYRVEAVENNSLYDATSYSNIFCVNQDPIVFFPNAFTPTQSTNLNDSFGPKGAYIKSYNMKIINRWGQIVYSTDAGVPWNGKTNNGESAPESIYTYIVNVKGYENKWKYYSGTIIILK